VPSEWFECESDETVFAGAAAYYDKGRLPNAPGLAEASEPVKPDETRSYEAFCVGSPSSTFGSLIQATVGSFGGSGRRWRNRAGFAA